MDGSPAGNHHRRHGDGQEPGREPGRPGRVRPRRSDRAPSGLVPVRPARRRDPHPSGAPHAGRGTGRPAAGDRGWRARSGNGGVRRSPPATAPSCTARRWAWPTRTARRSLFDLAPRALRAHPSRRTVPDRDARRVPGRRRAGPGRGGARRPPARPSVPRSTGPAERSSSSSWRPSGRPGPSMDRTRGSCSTRPRPASRPSSEAGRSNGSSAASSRWAVTRTRTPRSPAHSLGARDGVNGLPARWLDRLADHEGIAAAAAGLVPLARRT